MEGARFVAECRTAPGFALEALGEYLALVERPGSPSTVPGELFEVGEGLLAALDEFEGEGYLRGRVPILQMTGDAEEIRFALAYLKKAG
jgi:gamma-glutamylcyclotransferase (GGCT)/AIG2-like uncharacterized protein YtfP